MKAKELRAQAREKLAQIPKKRYMVEALIYMAVVVVTSLIGQHFDKDDGKTTSLLILYLLEFLVMIFKFNLQVYFKRYQQKLAKEEGETPGYFVGLSSAHSWKCLVYNFFMSLLAFALTAFCLIYVLGMVVAGALAFSFSTDGNPTPIILTALGFLALFLLLWILVLWIQYRFYMTPYIIDDDIEQGNNRSIFQQMGASWRMMKGHVWKLFCLNISFIGWGLLTLLTFGILSIWTLPYQNLAQAEFYAQISGQEEK